MPRLTLVSFAVLLLLGYSSAQETPTVTNVAIEYDLANLLSNEEEIIFLELAEFENPKVTPKYFNYKTEYDFNYYEQWMTNEPTETPLTFDGEISIVDYDLSTMEYVSFPDDIEGWTFNQNFTEVETLELREKVEIEPCTTEKIQYAYRVAHIEAPFTAVLTFSDGTQRNFTGVYKSSFLLAIEPEKPLY